MGRQDGATAENEKAALEKQKADRIALIQSEGEFRSKVAGLTAGPHDQFSAIRDAYRERLDIALQIYAVDQKADELKKRTLDAEHDMEVSIAQLGFRDCSNTRTWQARYSTRSWPKTGSGETTSGSYSSASRSPLRRRCSSTGRA
jgi:hypothetical protein